MGYNWVITLILAFAWSIGFPAYANTVRSHAERSAFMREHPCPMTGRRSGSCPGYIVDHVQPLCAGGADRAWNMQWQTAQDAHQKDRWEWAYCRGLKRRDR